MLALLLDGLHEDLDRVLDNLCIEETDMTGLPDEKVADGTRASYHARMALVMMDSFQVRLPPASQARLQGAPCGKWQQCSGTPYVLQV